MAEPFLHGLYSAIGTRINRSPEYISLVGLDNPPTTQFKTDFGNGVQLWVEARLRALATAAAAINKGPFTFHNV